MHPIYDNKARDTSTSAAEGRLVSSLLVRRKRRARKRRKKNDGQGGYGSKKMKY